MDLERLRGKAWKRRIAGIVASVAAIATLGLFSTTASAADTVAEPIQTSSVSSASSVTAFNPTSSTGSFAGTSLVSQSSTSASQSVAQQSVAGSSSGSQTQQSAQSMQSAQSVQSATSQQTTSSGSSLTSASAEAESTTRITSVDQPSKPTETNSGNKPKLPSKLTAHWSDGSESQTPIAWNTSGVDFSNRTGKDRTVTVTGTVCVGDDSDNNGGVGNADGSKANGSKANSAGSDAKSSNGTANSAANSAANGAANGASGNASNNNTSNNTVGVCEKLLSGQSGDVTASGASASANSSASSDGVVSVKASVIVHSAAVKGVVVDGETSVTTASGIKPQLPVNAKVSWNDGGDDSLEPIDWPQFDGYRTRDGGTFTLGGLVVDRTVNVRVTVTPAVVKSVDDTVSVTTVVGKAPTMPGTVKVTWTNGDVTEAPATWDAIPADSYRNPGTFTVSGTVTTGSEQDGDLETHAVTAKVIVGTIAYEVQYGDDDDTAAQSGSNGTGINIPTDNKTVTTDTRQTSQSQLSKTGTEVAAIAVIVVVLAVIGAVVVIVVRRRR
ncbi:Ig-like domain-containing protein [Bifidobacterium tissieri]|nr:Ig-like domain-containing protein [Bifidobacterium tissieri]